MSFLVAVLWTALVLPQAKVQNLNSLIDGVQGVFSKMSDYSADFDQILTNELNQSTIESGHVYLKRDRMMRWEYKTPRGDKFFVSDGKTAYFYVVADKVVRRAPAKDVIDERMTMVFLLGRSNLSEEFTQIRDLPGEKPLIPGDRVIEMTPKKKGDLERVKIEVDPVGYRIRRLMLRQSDGNRMEFIFRNIDDKTKRESGFFQFRLPPGVTVVDGL
jgi:chaperone LolA